MGYLEDDGVTGEFAAVGAKARGVQLVLWILQ